MHFLSWIMIIVSKMNEEAALIWKTSLLFNEWCFGILKTGKNKLFKLFTPKKLKTKIFIFLFKTEATVIQACSKITSKDKVTPFLMGSKWLKKEPHSKSIQWGRIFHNFQDMEGENCQKWKSSKVLNPPTRWTGWNYMHYFDGDAKSEN